MTRWGAGKRHRSLRSEPEPLSSAPAHEPPGWSDANTPAQGEPLTILETEYGWPWLALRSRWKEAMVDADTGPRLLTPADRLSGGIPIGTWPPPVWLLEEGSFGGGAGGFEGDRIALPLIPLWRGLLPSIALYAVVFFFVVLVVSAPGAFVRRRRRRTRRCVRCRYDLRVAVGTACPECGWTIGRRIAFATNGRLVIAAVLLLAGAAATTAGAVALAQRFPGPRPIHIAARFGETAALRRLLAAGVSVDELTPSPVREWSDSVGQPTPLIWATAHDQVEAMSVLIDAGADLEVGAGWVSTALTLAAVRGDERAVTRLLRAGAVIEGAPAPPGTKWMTTPLVAAAAHGHLEIVRRLLAAGADPSPDVPTRFDDGSRFPDPEIVGSPVYAAIDGEHAATALMLIDAGAKVHESVEPLVWEAVDHRLDDVVAALLVAGAAPDQSNNEAWVWTPLRRATTLGNLAVARLLVEAGADPHRLDGAGQTLLFRANGLESNPALLEWLLDLGVDVDRSAIAGRTALMQALDLGCPRVAETLLEHGADPTLVDARGRAALHWARHLLEVDPSSLTDDDRRTLERVEQAIVRWKP